MKTPLKALAVMALSAAVSCFAHNDRPLPDGFTMRLGIMEVVKDGHMTQMLDDMKTANGIIVKTDGVVIRPNGRQFSIHDGDLLTFDGVFTRDGDYVAPVATTTTVVTTSTTAVPVVSDCVIMRGGQVLVMRNGQSYGMEGNSLRLADGTVVARDGTVNNPDGRTVTMREGDSITLDGRTRKFGM